MAGPILVTGAAGFAGGHLVSLIRHDGPVEGWYRPGVPPPQASLALEGVSWRAVDLRDPHAVRDGDRGARVRRRSITSRERPTRARPGRPPTSPWNSTSASRTCSSRAVARQAPACRVLVTTSAAVYAPSDEPLTEDARIGPSTPYGVSKLAQEMVAVDAARHEGLDVVIVRPFNHIGPGQDLGFFAPAFARQLARIEAGLEPGPMRVGNLSPRRDLSDVRDTVRAYRLLMHRGARGEIYNVCRGEAVEIGALLDMLRAAVSVPVEVVVDPDKLRPVDVPLLLGDHARLTRATGWTPEIPLARTLADILAEQRAMVR